MQKFTLFVWYESFLSVNHTALKSKNKVKKQKKRMHFIEGVHFQRYISTYFKQKSGLVGEGQFPYNSQESRFSSQYYRKLSVVHAHYPSTQEAVAGRSDDQVRPWLHGKFKDSMVK